VKRTPAVPPPLFLRLLSTCGLIGEAAPFAPATWTSLVVLPFILPYARLALPAQVALLVLVIGVGVVASGRAERYYGHDAKAITIDEVAGMLVAFLAVPVAEASRGNAVLLLGAGFMGFRLFDVVKPFPAGRAQRLPGGMGIMADDLLAGLYANLCLRALNAVLNQGGSA
jgi:phosphatidylglycerophosphatase A